MNIDEQKTKFNVDATKICSVTCDARSGSQHEKNLMRNCTNNQDNTDVLPLFDKNIDIF